MEYSSIVHFANKNYCFALTPGKFVFRLEAKRKDLKKVIIHTQDKYIKLHVLDTHSETPMKLVGSDKYKDYFEVILDIDVICLRYYFELIDFDGNTTFFSNHNFYDTPVEDVECMFDCPQNLREEEMFIVPEWAKNKVVYQIFPSRFATDANVSDEEWYKEPISYKDNLHGNIRGIINHLDYIKELGVDIIYLTPIFKSNSSHKYNTDDYYQIDPDFGTNEDFKELVKKAHEMGLYVIIDGVFNHTSDHFFAFEDVVKNGRESKYWDWYYFKDFPLISEWGKKPNYLTFGYAGPMPKLRLSNPEVADYFIDVASYWVNECDIDGIRLDVGDEISHFFWKKFRSALKLVKPELLIIGEIWHFAGDFLEGDEWDTVMNYTFQRSINDMIINESGSVETFIENQNFMAAHTHPDVMKVLWNLIGSHDTIRFLTACGANKEKLKLAAAFMLLHQGMPMIYYGDEVAMEGGNDPDCRRGMLWDTARQDQAVLSYYKKLLSLRHNYPIITCWDDREIKTDESKKVLIEKLVYDNEELTLVFNIGSEKIFDGVLLPYQVIIN